MQLDWNALSIAGPGLGGIGLTGCMMDQIIRTTHEQSFDFGAVLVVGLDIGAGDGAGAMLRRRLRQVDAYQPTIN